MSAAHGSQDDNPPRIVDTRETLLAILVYPDGRVHFSSNQSHAWVADTLQRITDAQKARATRAANAAVATGLLTMDATETDPDEADRLDYLGKVQG